MVCCDMVRLGPLVKMNSVFDLFCDDEDGIFLGHLNYKRPRRQRVIRPRVDLFHYYSDWVFVKRFRMDKETVMSVFREIEADITPKTMRNNAVAPMNKLLATLRFYATGTFMSVISDLGGISETSARDFVEETTKAIAQLRLKYVRFPDNFQAVKSKFYAIAKFPNVIMAIDCTHVKIQSPGGDDAEVFRNRKGYFSLNVQTVCDSELRVMDCVARWPGSTHDQRIFNNSRLKHRLENKELQGLVVGDAGYENHSYMVTPLSKVTARAENLYNESIIRTRNPIERSYGVIKRRFPVLAFGLRCSVRLSMVVIQAVMVLHNIALQDPLPEPEIDVSSYECAKITVERLSLGQPNMQRAIINDYFAKL